nr:putative late blight resistance protein homolog R1A-4 [Ipomoea batatas]
MCNRSVNKARSVLCLHNDEMPMVNDPKLVRFSLLRVLDLTSPLYNKGVYLSFQNLSSLVLLEYLAFMSNRSLGSEGLDSVLSKNQKLHTLVVWHSAAGWRPNYTLLPSTIWGLPQLRHLEFRNCFRVEPPSIVKEKLQSLYWLSIFHCTKEVISKIPNIKTLGIFYEGRLITDNGVSCNGASSLENLCHLSQLEALTIEAEYAIPKCISLPGINAFPCNLRKLKLSKTYLPWKDNIAAIALLPGLEVLKLKMDAFYGPEWEATEGGFQRLKFLLLENTDLKIWNAFDDEFPILEHLVLKHCENLEGIPTVFSNVTTLKSIDLEWCGQALLSCAKNIQQEHLDYGNNEIKVLNRNPQTTHKQLTFYKGQAIMAVHRYAYIANVSVAKYARRQGIASNMLYLAADVAMSEGMKKLFVHVNEKNKIALDLYRKVGFEVVKAASSHVSSEQKLLMSMEF